MSSPNVSLDGGDDGAPQPLPKSIAKQIEDAKAASAPAPDPLNRNPNQAPDPFDLKSLVINQSYLQTVGSTELLTSIKIGKPNRQEFFRINPNFDYGQSFGILEDKIDRGFYLVAPLMMPELMGEFFVATLYVGITKQNNLFVWPCRLPDENGKQMEWHRTAIIGAETGKTQWTSIRADIYAGFNKIHVADGDLGEPKWPSLPYEEILRIAFREEGIIGSVDHPIVKRLRGQI